MRELGGSGQVRKAQAAFGIACFDERRGDRFAVGARQHALVEPLDAGQCFLTGAHRLLEVARHGGGPGLGKQREARHLRVVGQPGSLDGALGRLQRFGESPADLQREGEPDHHSHEVLALPADTRYRDAALQVADGIVVALAEVLGETEVVRGVQPAREDVIAEAVKRRDRFAAGTIRLLRPPQRVGGKAGQRGRHGCQGRVAPRARGHEGPFSPIQRGLEVRVEDRIGGELHLQRGGVRRCVIGLLRERCQQAGVRGVVATEEVLGAGACADEAHSHGAEVRGDEGQGVQQGTQTLLQAPAGHERARERDEKLKSPGRGTPDPRAAAATRRHTSVRRSRARVRRLSSRLDEDRDGLLVADGGEALDMVRARRRRAAPPRRARRRRGRVRRGARPRRPPHRSCDARSDGESGSATPHRSARAARRAAARPHARGPAPSPRPAIEAPSARSTGSPATAAPRNSARAPLLRPATC